MSKYNKWILLTVTSILSFSLFQAVSKQFVSMAQDNTNPKDDRIQPTCYDMAMPVTTVISPRETLENQLTILEKQYKENKIDQKTYKQSKETILKQLESLKDK